MGEYGYLRPQAKQLPGCLHVVEVSVEVGEEDGDLTTGQEKVGDLGHGHEVSDVRLARRGSAPVDLQVPRLQDLVDPLLTQDLLEVPGDELLLLSRT